MPLENAMPRLLLRERFLAEARLLAHQRGMCREMLTTPPTLIVTVTIAIVRHTHRLLPDVLDSWQVTIWSWAAYKREGSGTSGGRVRDGSVCV